MCNFFLNFLIKKTEKEKYTQLLLTTIKWGSSCLEITKVQKLEVYSVGGHVPVPEVYHILSGNCQYSAPGLDPLLHFLQHI